MTVLATRYSRWWLGLRWYLSRCCHVSMFIAGQTRGIPPASNGGGVEIGTRTSVAIVILVQCAEKVFCW